MSLANLNDINTPVTIPTLNVSSINANSTKTSALVLGGSSIVSIQSGIVGTATQYPVHVAFAFCFQNTLKKSMYFTSYNRK